MREEEMITLLRARSESAVQHLSQVYGNYCRTVAFRILQNEEDTAECLNDVYLKVWNATKDTEIRHLKSYLATVTRNMALDMVQKRQTQEAASDRLMIEEELAECLRHTDESIAVTDSLVIKQTLDTFLATLGKTERWVFMRRYWNMDSIKEIAAACGKREETVRMMLSRTRKKLKIRLEKEGIHV